MANVTDTGDHPDDDSEQLVNLYLLEALKAEGQDHIFLVPGGMIEPFMPNFSVAGIEAVVACHEAGAAYMADGYARARRSFAVCMGIGGPGVTNMVTAISAAYADRSPVMVLAGSVPYSWEGLAPFQDSSQTGIPDKAIMEPMVVSNLKIPLAESAGHFLQMTIRKMMGVENRPGFLEVPFYMQSEKIRRGYEPVQPTIARIVDRERVRQVPRSFNNATRITLLVGNGTLRSEASELVQAFAEKYAIPVVTTLRAKGAISEQNDMSLGVFGMGGTLQAEAAMFGMDETEHGGKVEQTEMVLILGATLNENNSYMSDQIKCIPSLIRVDNDPNLPDQNKYAEYMLVSDIKTLFEWLENNEHLYAEALNESRPQREAWIAQLRSVPYFDPATQLEHPEPVSGTDEHRPNGLLNPSRVITMLRTVAPHDTIVVADSGANTYFTGHNWTCYGPNNFFLLSATGPMGYGIAMAIGVKMARPHQPVLAIIGDGDMAMHGMEFATAVRYKVPIVVVILDNHALGNVYLNVEKYGKEAEELANLPQHNWALFARAMGGDGIYVDNYEDLPHAYEAAFAADGPFIVDVRTNKDYHTPNTKEPDLPKPAPA